MTIAVDSSAIIAIIRGEPEGYAFDAVLEHEPCVIGWPSVFECRIVCIRQLQGQVRFLDALLRQTDTQTVAFDGALHDLATEAFRLYGKGRHAAALNFGDCMTYAVAKSHNLPLLFKGGDFGKTDIAVHPASVIIESADI